MGDIGLYGIVAVVLGLLGLFFKSKSKPEKSAGGTQEIINEFSEKASKAGVDLADNLGAPSAVRKRRVLDWLRTRTGASGDGDG